MCSSAKNSSSSGDSSTIVPTDLDVLFGRGPKIAGHNAKFRGEVKRFTRKYRQTGKGKKSIISNNVVKCVKANGGRFLALSEGKNKRWYEVSDDRAYNKVSQGEFIDIQHLYS